MIVDHSREKLIHAIVFFTKNTRHCYKLKLFKLLNFLDFEHYRQTGKPVTGLHYHAYPKGPAPGELDEEINSGVKPDLQASVKIRVNRNPQTHEIERVDFKPIGKFDPDLFSKRERRIMEILTEIFRDAKAEDMTGASHERGMPWEKVYQKGAGSGREIPYDLVFTSKPVFESEPIDKQEHEYRLEARRGLEKFIRA